MSCKITKQRSRIISGLKLTVLCSKKLQIHPSDYKDRMPPSHRVLVVTSSESFANDATSSATCGIYESRHKNWAQNYSPVNDNLGTLPEQSVWVTGLTLFPLLVFSAAGSGSSSAEQNHGYPEATTWASLHRRWCSLFLAIYCRCWTS